jgi:hypothetical protein
MTIAEQIYAIVKTLPKDQAGEILSFAERVYTRHLSAKQPANTGDSAMPWTEFVDSLTGAWAQDFPTLEDIRAESRQDVFRESL